MKPDNNYISLWFCPVNGDSVNIKKANKEILCPACGSYSESPTSHLIELQGKWFRPNWWEWLQGERAVFKSKALIEGK